MLDRNTQTAYRQMMIGEAAGDALVAKFIDGDPASLSADLLNDDVTARFAALAKTALLYYDLHDRRDADAVYVCYMANKVNERRGQAP